MWSTVWALLAAVAPAAEADTSFSEAERIFALQVQPIFEAKCAGCHAEDPDALEGELDLRSSEGLRRGGAAYGSSLLVPGDSSQSALVAIVARQEAGYEMPPKEADALTQEEVWAIRDWIDAGAAWPDESRVAEIYAAHAEGVTVATSGGLTDSWTKRKYDPKDLWAFQPLRRSFDEYPSADHATSIDAFIDSAAKQEGIEVAARADRLTLIRRATFDLLGLPPTPEEIDHFVNDPADEAQAFAALVDRLLASPHYGEQWARHWLDVARYADSSGFANDWERPNAWRYRDYVIRAFNQDKPFDRFVLEQLAGDELIAAAEKDGGPSLTEAEQAELRIAAGFLRMGPWEHTGMSVAKVTRQQFLDDVTDAVGQVFLGQALQCCRCHDHKFDPIPTRDYYSVQAIFATTQFAEVETCWLDSENRDGMQQDRHYHELRHERNAQVLKELQEQQRRYEAEWFAARGLAYKSTAEAKKAGLKGGDLPPKQELTPEQYGRERIARKWENRFSWEFDRYEPVALSVYDGATVERSAVMSRLKLPRDPFGEGIVEKTTILTGGDPFSPSVEVAPAVLSAVPGGLEFDVTNSNEGRRLDLARWIVSQQNPLTARVLANRIWTHHFGRGIAGNPNNFGATGKKPTHPALLDWLAVQLQSNDWSIKAMHRLIMNSNAYCRTAAHPAPEALAERDPLGQSYAVFQPRRLAAEEIRDAMLQVSGELNLAQGGIPVRPDMNREAALQPRMIMGTFAPSYVANPRPHERNRRSIYAHKIRGHRMPFMETFNQPGSETPCELRDQSNITPQAFTLLNSEETNDRALALATRVSRETNGDREAVARAMQLVWSRRPTAKEIDDAIEHWDAMEQRHAQFHPQPQPYPTEVVREAIDENTGKPFQFSETLFEYRDYDADRQAADATPRQRALADVCLALLNSNEFIYVY